MQLKERHGKYSAECYYTDPDTGKRRRVLRATGIRVDGSAEAERTAEHVGRQKEAELNGAKGVARARKSRRTGAATLTLAIAAHIARKRVEACSARSIGLTERSVVHPLRFFGADIDPWEISEERLQAYAAYALQTRKPATVARELAEVRNALKAAGVKPMPEFPRIGGITARELALTPEESARLIAAVSLGNGWPKDWPSRRDYILVYRALGLCYSELYTIGPSSFDWSANLVRVRGTKRKTRDRPMPMGQSRAVFERALELMHARGDGALFPVWSNERINDYLTAAAQRARVVAPGVRVSVNVLRASFATELINADVHPKKIAMLMGHSNTRTVDRWYARLRPDDLVGAVGELVTYDLQAGAHTAQSAAALAAASQIRDGTTRAVSARRTP